MSRYDYEGIDYENPKNWRPCLRCKKTYRELAETIGYKPSDLICWECRRRGNRIPTYSEVIGWFVQWDPEETGHGQTH